MIVKRHGRFSLLQDGTSILASRSFPQLSTRFRFEPARTLRPFRFQVRKKAAITFSKPLAVNLFVQGCNGYKHGC